MYTFQVIFNHLYSRLLSADTLLEALEIVFMISKRILPVAPQQSSGVPAGPPLTLTPLTLTPLTLTPLTLTPLTLTPVA